MGVFRLEALLSLTWGFAFCWVLWNTGGDTRRDKQKGRRNTRFVARLIVSVFTVVAVNNAALLTLANIQQSRGVEKSQVTLIAPHPFVHSRLQFAEKTGKKRSLAFGE